MAQPDYIPQYSISDYSLWEGDWELWNGIPVSMSPSPNFQHQKIGSRILVALNQQLSQEPCEGKCLAIYEMDWHVNSNTVVRPDVMVLCEEPLGNFVEKAPALIAEIRSPSTRDKDLTAKRDLYASNGVKYYLIFDPENRDAQFLKLEKGTYRKILPDEDLILDDSCHISLVGDEIL
jgi:Uma2 family endonuclease